MISVFSFWKTNFLGERLPNTTMELVKILSLLIVLYFWFYLIVSHFWLLCNWIISVPIFTFLSVCVDIFIDGFFIFCFLDCFDKLWCRFSFWNLLKSLENFLFDLDFSLSYIKVSFNIKKCRFIKKFKSNWSLNHILLEDAKSMSF